MTAPASGANAPPIDRHALVSRHNLELSQSEKVQVGNGEFAFTADITGLQSFEPCCTMSHWGWYTEPLPAGKTLADFQWTAKPTHGRMVEHEIGTGDAISKWRFANPYRLHLGRLALRMTKADGTPATKADLKNAHQTLDLWSGRLTSRFELEGVPVCVVTCCHPRLDAVAARIESPLVAAGRLMVELAFPFPDLKASGGYGDWARPDAHETRLALRGERRADFTRKLDADGYHVSLAWSSGKLAAGQGKDRHCFTLSPRSGNSVEFVCAFAAKPLGEALPTVDDALAASREHWAAFWRSGGAIDLSGSKDPRAKELERRIVLSQYLMAVNEAGSLPPQEAGLVN